MDEWAKTDGNKLYIVQAHLKQFMGRKNKIRDL
jgi:hypothetical protein